MKGHVGKIYSYWATAVAGLEEVAREEMREVVKGVRLEHIEKGRDYTRIFFNYERSPQALLSLRSVDSVYATLTSISGITVGGPGVERIKNQLAKVDMGVAKRLALSLDASVAVDCAQINATVQGRHRFRAAELVKEVQHVFATQHGIGGIATGQRCLHLQIQVKGRSAILGMRLSAADRQPNHAMAYCLGHLLGLDPGDQVLWLRRDGTEADELRQAFGADVWVGLPTNGKNTVAVTGGFYVEKFHIPILDAMCSHVLVNLRASDSVAILPELARILPFGGIAVVEVETPEPFVAALRGHAFDITAALPVQSRGRKRILFVLERLPEEDLLQVELGV